MWINEIDATDGCCCYRLPLTLIGHIAQIPRAHMRAADRIVSLFFIAHKMNLIYVFLSSNQENGISSIRSRFICSELLLFAPSRIQQWHSTFLSSSTVGSRINDSRRSELLLLFGWYFDISFVIGETFAFFANFPMIGESKWQWTADIWSILPTSQ